MLRNGPFHGFVYRGIFFDSIFWGYTRLILPDFFCLIVEAWFARVKCDFFVNFQKHCYVLAFPDAYQLEGQFLGSLKFRGFSIKLRSLKTE